MKKLNYPLIIGTIILIGLILIVIFYEQIIKIDPYAMNLGNVGGYHDGKFIITKPVQPANDINIFGTDSLGRDIFSQIIEGSRITLKIALLITLFRFIIALPFAFFAGFGGRISSAIIKFFTVAFSAIPALFFSYIVLGLSSLREFELAQSITVFIIVLTQGFERVMEYLAVPSIPPHSG